jgi:hypothetical protein
MQIHTPTTEISRESPQKAKDRTFISSNDTAPGIYPKKHKTGYSRDACALMFITTLFTIAKLWKQPRCPTTDEWDQENVVYIRN